MKKGQVEKKRLKLQKVLSNKDASDRLVTFVKVLMQINEREKLIKNT